MTNILLFLYGSCTGHDNV